MTSFDASKRESYKLDAFGWRKIYIPNSLRQYIIVLQKALQFIKLIELPINGTFL